MRGTSSCKIRAASDCNRLVLSERLNFVSSHGVRLAAGVGVPLFYPSTYDLDPGSSPGTYDPELFALPGYL